MPAFGLSINSLIDSFTAVMPLSNAPFEFKPIEILTNHNDEANFCELTYGGTGTLLGLR